MRKHKIKLRDLAIVAAAAGALHSLPVYGGTTAQPTSGAVYPGTYPYAGNTNGNNYATISLSGSTALRNFTISSGFTLLPQGSSIFLSSGTFTANGIAGQLAPSTPAAKQLTSTVEDIPALRVEWHEQGSVEGDLELVTDQLYGGNVNNLPSGQAPASLVTRAPTVSNPVWINGTAGGTVIADNTSNSGGWYYGTTNSSSTATTGQSPIQMAIADVKPIQSFSIAGTASPFALPYTAGYGKGNPLGVTPSDSSGLGVVSSREALVDQTTLNIPDSTHPNAPWTTAGLNNLQTNTVAITATTFTANPGTGLSNLNKTDAQFLQMTGRLQNGATFQMSTRDVNSGTRNTAATNTGIDPSWAVGLNDGGNTLVTTNATAADSQDQINRSTLTAADGTSISIPTIHFSGKTSGGVLRTTVANARMAVGTLSLPDSISTSGSANGAYTGGTPTDILTYNGVSPTFNTITNGTYAIWQQEQYVTVKNTNSAFSQNVAVNYNSSQWAATTDLQTGIKGDTPNTSSTQTGNFSGGQITLPAGSRGGYVVGQVLSGTGIAAGTTVTGITYNPDGTIQDVAISDPNASGNGLTYNVSGGDVANFRSNVINAVQVAGGTVGFATVNNPGDQLVNNAFILPQFMQVTKPYDGQATSPNTPYDINNNPNGYIGDTLHAAFAANADGKKTSAPSVAVTYPGSTTETVPTAGSAPTDSGYYGQAQRGAGQAGTGVGASPIVPLTNGDIAITPSNYLFGNFANTGTRDYNSFQYGVAALKALYNSGYGVDGFDSTAATTSANNSQGLTDAQLDNNGVLSAGVLSSALGPESTFLGQRGESSFSPTETAYHAANAFQYGVTKGDLIVMGDYNGDARFDGQDIKAMAIGTALSENTSTNTLSSMADVTTGVLRKNAALDFVQSNTADAAYTAGVASNASGFIRQSARIVLSSSTTPAGATFLYNTSTGTAFTYDQTGANAFNKSDVNQDGVVDFNDALVVDNNYGLSYTNVSSSVMTSEPAPLTGAPEIENLVLAQQIDGEPSIGAADLGVISTAMTGTGTTNWYGYAANKSKAGVITYNRTGGAVNVYSGASLNINSGAIQILSAVDPFTQNSNTSNPSSTADTSRSLAINVAGGELEYSGSNNVAASGFVEERVSSLNISSGSVVIDPATIDANRTVLVAGSINISGGKLDLGNSDAIVHTGSLSAVTALVKTGFNGGTWTGAGITSAAAANDSTHLTALGVIQNPGTPALSTFDRVPSTTADVLIKYTYYGDTNLDGVVDGSDYSVIDSSFLSESVGGPNVTGWGNGDFNYDGVVDGSDYTLIDNAYNQQADSPFAAEVANPSVAIADQVSGTSAVPEPTTLSLLGLGAMGLLGRRRRQV